jgi:ABC-type molybdate transport system substrate-binding protein
VADLGIDQLIVLQNKPGIQVVGRVPNEFTADIIMGAGVASSGSAGAASFIKFLKSPEASAAIQAHGMMPD